MPITVSFGNVNTVFFSACFYRLSRIAQKTWTSTFIDRVVDYCCPDFSTTSTMNSQYPQLYGGIGDAHNQVPIPSNS
jgi:hypothetical protein